MTLTSGRWITYMALFFWPLWGVWELVQLARRRAGNKSARTMSQWIVRQAEKDPKWKWIKRLFPAWVVVTGIWLFWHWEVF